MIVLTQCHRGGRAIAGKQRRSTDHLALQRNDAAGCRRQRPNNRADAIDDAEPARDPGLTSITRRSGAAEETARQLGLLAAREAADVRDMPDHDQRRGQRREDDGHGVIRPQ